MSSCRKARRRLERAFDGHLGVDEEFLLEEHLAGCLRCREEADLQALLLDGLACQPEPPVERLDVAQALLKIHGRLEEEPLRVLPWRWIASTAAVAAAAFVLALPLPSWLHGGGGLADPEPSVPAGDSLAQVLPGLVPELGAKQALDQQVTVLETVLGTVLGTVRVHPTFSFKTEIDIALHAQVQAEVRAALAMAEQSHPDDVDALLAAFDLATASLVADGWPVPRLVVGLIGDESPSAAGAACLITGRRPTRLGMVRLERALDSPVALTAVQGLIDAGPLGHEGLAQALWVPGATEPVLETVSSLGDEAKVRWAVAALLRAPEDVDTAAWSEFVASAGQAGAIELMERLDDPRIDRSEVIAGLASSGHGADVLLGRLKERVSPRDCEGLLELAERLKVPEAFEFLQEQAWSGASRDRAALVLAGYPGARPLVSLLMLDEGRRLEAADLGAAWHRALEVDASRVESLAQEHVDRRARTDSRRLLEGLTLAGHSGAVPALIELAVHGALADDDREHAFLIISELGTADDVPRLSAAFASFTPSDRDRAAACLISLYRLGGTETVQRVLSGASERTSARVLSHLNGGARASSRLLLARELEPVLASQETPTWRTIR